VKKRKKNDRKNPQPLDAIWGMVRALESQDLKCFNLDNWWVGIESGRAEFLKQSASSPNKSGTSDSTVPGIVAPWPLTESP